MWGGGGVPRTAIPRKKSAKTVIPHRKSIEYDRISKCHFIVYHKLHLAILFRIALTFKYSFALALNKLR